jgi:hypothetical protein
MSFRYEIIDETHLPKSLAGLEDKVRVVLEMDRAEWERLKGMGSLPKDGFNNWFQEQRATRPWCMCEKVSLVARDMFATCAQCEGQDAYGTSKDRPADKRKKIQK